MSHEIESLMFSGNQVPWHGLGVQVDEAPTSADALVLAGLDWQVLQADIYGNGSKIQGYKLNYRNTDNMPLGVVTDRYSVIQNYQAFEFTDKLLGQGVKYDTSGSLFGGKKVFMNALLPAKFQILGDAFDPYVVFTNSHDGTGSIRVIMTPIRVVCKNTLNLAISDAKRIWSTMHVGPVMEKMDEARKTLLLAEFYMEKLNSAAESLVKKKLSDDKITEFIDTLFPLPEDAGIIQSRNIDTVRDDLRQRIKAPDLANFDHTAYQMINAVSDLVLHATPLRKTQNYKENLFDKTISGHPVIDKSYELLLRI